MVNGRAVHIRACRSVAMWPRLYYGSAVVTKRTPEAHRAIASISVMVAIWTLVEIKGEFHMDKQDERDGQDILSRLFSDDRRAAERCNHQYGYSYRKRECNLAVIIEINEDAIALPGHTHLHVQHGDLIRV